jgi:hypothetical protein
MPVVRLNRRDKNVPQGNERVVRSNHSPFSENFQEAPTEPGDIATVFGYKQETPMELILLRSVLPFETRCFLDRQSYNRKCTLRRPFIKPRWGFIGVRIVTPHCNAGLFKFNPSGIGSSSLVASGSPSLVALKKSFLVEHVVSFSVHRFNF